MSRGMLYAIVAYFLWGILPVYWKALKMVPAYELLCHRMVWSLIFLLTILILKRDLSWLGRAFKDRRIYSMFTATAFILSANWFTYIWAVNAGFIVEASLGYFINPLFYVLLGVIFLREKLRPVQWVAIVIAAIGVLYLTLQYGSFPWIALTLALTFGLYGLMRKQAPLNSLQGLSLEMIVLFLPASFFLFYFEAQHTGSFGHLPFDKNMLLLMAGVVTALPLLFFAAGARLIRLTTLGLLQYLAPTLQFLTGVVVYKEPFTTTRFVGFLIIWISLAIFTAESLVELRKRRKYRIIQGTNGVFH